jgi:hypothetical protein
MPPHDTTAEHSDGLMPMDQLQGYLTAAEEQFTSADPYTRQHAYDTAARLHTELARHTDDPTWAKAATMAGQMYAVFAARIRFEHHIPTPFPKAEAEHLHLGRCEQCGRPWQESPAGSCPDCPLLLHGPTPGNRDEAQRLPAGVPVDLTTAP